MLHKNATKADVGDNVNSKDIGSSSGQHALHNGDTITFNVENTANYDVTIDKIIDDKLGSNRVKRNYMRLVLNCKGQNDKDISLYIDRNDIYLIGFEIDNTIFEFGKTDDKKTWA